MPTQVKMLTGVAPFPAWSITLPAPLAFPREPFAAALAEHAALLQEHAQRVVELTREIATSQYPHIPIVDLTAVIVARRDAPAEVRVEPRGDAAHYVAAYRGILRPLLFRSEAPRLPIVVIAKAAISLHVARIDAPIGGDDARYRLAVEPAELAVEPIVQKHRTSGLGPLLVTRWMHPDREARYAWATIPPEPQSDDEAADRVLVHHAPLARQRLQAFLSENGQESKAVVIVMSVPDHGDGLDVIGGDDLSPIREGFPDIASAIAAHRERVSVPVFIFMGKKGALRWMARREGIDWLEPPRIVESLPSPPQPALIEHGSPEDAPNAGSPGRRLNDAELWDALQQGACFDEVDQYLGGMTREELDAEIAKVGFDPEREAAQGPGLRESVINAIVDRRLDDEPPEGI